MLRSDRDHPFFRPLWRRVALCLAIAGWSGVEFWQGGPSTWFWLTLALFAYALWTFIITFPKPGDGEPP